MVVEELKTQICLKSELASGKGLIPAAFGTQAPVGFEASIDCYREAARAKSKAHSEGLGGKRKVSQ